MNGDSGFAPLTSSVALCTYNGAAYLREQLDSIIGQTLQVDEIVIADDGSDDGTVEVLQEYADRYPGVLRLILHGRRLGSIRNFELALGECRGDIIFLSDQDDVWLAHKVETMLERFDDEPSLQLLFSDGHLIDASGADLGASLWERWDFSPTRRWGWKRLRHSAFVDLVNNNNKITGATVAMRRTLLAGSLPVDAPQGYWHDTWFGLHAAARDGLNMIETPLIRYRVHPQQQVGLAFGGRVVPTSGVSRPQFLHRLKGQYPALGHTIDALSAGSRWQRAMARIT